MRSSPLPSVQYRDAAARELARRDRGAVALAVAVRPDQLAGPAVERDDRAARAGGGVEHAFDRERRAFELELGARAEVVGLEPPRDFELVEVGGVDLIERRVLRAAHVGGVVRPVAVLRARHAGRPGRTVRAVIQTTPAPSTATSTGARAFQCLAHLVSPDKKSAGPSLNRRSAYLCNF